MLREAVSLSCARRQKQIETEITFWQVSAYDQTLLRHSENGKPHRWRSGESLGGGHDAPGMASWPLVAQAQRGDLKPMMISTL